MNDNDLRITIYSSGTTALDAFEYAHAQNLTYNSTYPVGWASCSFFLPGDPTYLGRIEHKMLVKITNGFATAWAGVVTNKRIGYNRDTAGIYVDATGHLGDVMMRRQIRKPWAETRLDESTWRWDTTATAAEKCTLDRTNRLRFTPKAESWNNNDFARILMTAPTGQVWKRITFNYDFTEVNNWRLAVANGAGADLWSVTATGTGSQNITLGANEHQVLRIYFQNTNGAAQTPASDGTVYGQITNFVGYTETGAINPTEIIKDVTGYATEFSTDVTQIASNTLAIVPFVAEPMTYADIIAQAAGYGDASFNPYAFGVRDLDASNLPILFYEAYPALTDYDYTVLLTDQQLSQFEAEQNIEQVRNWIAVQYNDENGRNVWVTPDDNANLKDTTSIAAYGRRDEWITLQTTSLTTATNYARRYLAKYKDMQWRASSAIPITGYIKNRAGDTTPASLIQVGKRLRIANYLNDLNGTGLTLTITGADYDDASNTMTCTIGESNNLDVLLARMNL